MKLIKEICEHITEEIDDAECYAKLALHYKEEQPDIAKVYYWLSEQEMLHMNKLHEAVVSTIKKYRDEYGEPPESMMAVYNYLHDKQIEEAAEVKMLQRMYAE